jgi:carbamoyl-phosphate synthase/aspartate carbamoyltransferase
LRCLLKRGVEVMVCPWDYDFPALAGKDYDGLFISNGPGDPAMMEKTIKHISSAMEENRTPIFGICLGHQHSLHKHVDWKMSYHFAKPRLRSGHRELTR